MNVKIVLPVFLCAMVLSILSTVHMLSIVQNNLMLVLLLEFVNPLLNVVSLRYLITANNIKAQFKIAVIIGLGYATGATIGLALIN